MEWTFRNTIAKDRLDEVVEMYESLDFEVKVEVYNSGFTGDSETDDKNSCAHIDDCMSGGEYYKIYTRKIQ